MRLIPPESAPIETVETSPLTLTWDKPGHEGEYILGLPLITDAQGDDARIPDEYAEYLSSELSDSAIKWQVSNRGDRLEVVSIPIGGEDHEFLIEAAYSLLAHIQRPGPQITTKEPGLRAT